MTAYEVNNSRRTNKRLDRKHTHERAYVVNAGSISAAVADVEAIAPPTVFVESKPLVLVDIPVEETDSVDWYFATASWATQDSRKTREATQPTETGDSETTFSIGGGTQKVQEAVSQNAFGANAPEMGNAINVDEDGNVQGVDIVVPKMNFNETHFLSTSVVTQSYINGLRDLVGKTNNAAFRGFQAKELLLLSVSGSQRGAQDWRVTFEWSAGRNVTNQTVAGITGVNKNAHDFLWVLYEQSEDDTNKKMVPAAVGVYVAEVYEAGNYSNLGI